MPIEIPTDADYLPPGVHPATVAEVEAALVHAFAESKTRRPIYGEWLQLRDRLDALVTLGIQWINGSFATRKRDPGDIDIATFMQSAEVDVLSPERQDELNGLMASKDTTGLPLCDSFAIVEYPQGHPMHEAYVATKETFETAFFGYDSRAGISKGFVEVSP